MRRAPKFRPHEIPPITALFLTISALFLAGCSENRPAPSEASLPASPVPTPVAAETSPAPVAVSDETSARPSAAEFTSPPPETPTDTRVIERRFLAAQNDPEARIAAIRELVNATPIAALTTLNRLFSIERREDVKGEMLAALGDLDHTKERDYQLALCTKALAADQPMRVRYLAIHTMAELRDPRVRNLLLPLQNDPDREIRAAVAQALSDLSQ